MSGRALLLGLLLASAAAQQDEIDRWLDQLGGDDVEARIEAEARLGEAGEAALPGLERLLKSPDAEVRAVAARLRQAILRRIAREKVLGRVRQVTLKEGRVPFRRALELLREASGFEVAVADDVEDREVEAGLRARPWLEALALLCERHGGATVDRDPDAALDAWWTEAPDRRARFRIVRGRAGPRPAVHSGPLRVAAVRLRRERSSGSSEQVSLTLECLWQPDMRPLGGAGIDVDSVRARTTPLLPKRRSEPRHEPTAFLSLEAGVRCSPPPADEGLALTVQGVVWFWFAEARPSAVVRPAIEEKDRSVSLGDARLVVKSQRRENGSVRIAVEGRWAEGLPWSDAHGGCTRVMNVRIVDADGRPVASDAGSGGSWREAVGELHWSFSATRAALIDRIELDAPAGVFLHEVPFKLEQVPLPEW